jgi:hypothetical protein
MPAQNADPAPVRITARTCFSWCKSLKAWCKSASSCRDSALRFSGRFKIIVPLA